jgi:hypothetical protein
MNKRSLTSGIAIVLLLVGGGTYYAISNSSADTISNVAQNGIVVPTSSPDINGDIVSIIGNELTIKKYIVTATLSVEEKATNKTERQNISEEERKALKEEESVATPSEIIKLTIPVGTKIVKNSGEAIMSGDNSNLLLSNLDEAKPGYGIQIWKQNDEIILVKIKVI